MFKHEHRRAESKANLLLISLATLTVNRRYIDKQPQLGKSHKGKLQGFLGTCRLGDQALGLKVWAATLNWHIIFYHYRTTAPEIGFKVY